MSSVNILLCSYIKCEVISLYCQMQLFQCLNILQLNESNNGICISVAPSIYLWKFTSLEWSAIIPVGRWHPKKTQSVAFPKLSFLSHVLISAMTRARNIDKMDEWTTSLGCLKVYDAQFGP